MTLHPAIRFPQTYQQENLIPHQDIFQNITSLLWIQTF